LSATAFHPGLLCENLHRRDQGRAGLRVEAGRDRELGVATGRHRLLDPHQLGSGSLVVAEGATRTVADVERELGRLREALAKAGANARVELSWKVRAPKGWKA
jgi:hypothetical protein